MCYIQIIKKQQLKVHISMTCMNSNNFEQPCPGKPVNASRHWKKSLLSCHEPRNKPLQLQPLSRASVHRCCAQTTIIETASQPPPHSGDITQSSVHDYLKNRSKGLELEVMMESSSHFQVWSARHYWWSPGPLPGIRVRNHSHHRGSWLNPHATRPIM